MIEKELIRRQILHATHEIQEAEKSNCPDDLAMRAVRVFNRIRGVIFGARDSIEHVSELFDICELLENDPDVSSLVEPIASLIHDLRTEALNDVLQEHYENKLHALGHLEVEESEKIESERALAVLMTQLLPALKREKEPVDILWLQENHNAFYRRIRILLEAINPSEPAADWSIVQNMLPKNVRNKFIPSADADEQEKLKAFVNAHWHILQQMGPEHLASYLARHGLVKGGFAQALQGISPYLEQCTRVQPTPQDVRRYPPALLDDPDEQTLLFLNMRNYAYQRLQATGIDNNDPEVFSALFAHIQQDLHGMIPEPSEAFDTSPFVSVHERTVSFYEKVFDVSIPQRLRDIILVKGKDHRFPSLRQRIAMVDCEEPGTRRLILFPQGTGKSETLFLIKEHTKAKKMLLVCTAEMLKEIPGRIRQDECEEGRVPCYKNDEEPTIGIIQAGITFEELRKALDQEVVAVSYTMLGENSGFEGETVLEHIIGHSDPVRGHFDMLGIDECQLASNEKGQTTQSVFRLVDEIPDLYDKGRIIMTSATPFPGWLDDMVPAMRILDREHYRDVHSVHAAVTTYDPQELRVALMRGILNLDPPFDWERYVKPAYYKLSEGQKRKYQEILEEPMEHTQKMLQLQLCCQNPTLLPGNCDSIENGFYEKLAEMLRDDLTKHHAIFLLQDKYKQGIARPHEKRPDDTSTIVEFLKKDFPKVTFEIIDGDTSQTARQNIVARAKEMEQQKNGERMVIYVHLGTTTLVGQNLSFSCRLIVLNGFPWNITELSQGIARFAREGNEPNVSVSVMQPDPSEETLYLGIEQRARHKFAAIQRATYGGTVAQHDIEHLGEGDIGDIVSGKKRYKYGSDILRHLRTSMQEVALWFKPQRDAKHGSKEWRQFLEEKGEVLALKYTRKWKKTTQWNNAKFNAGLIEHLETGGIIQGDQYLDAGCGPFSLTLALGPVAVGSNVQKKRIIDNLDLNPHMFRVGRRMLLDQEIENVPQCFHASITDMSQCVPDGKYSLVNCALALDLVGREEGKEDGILGNEMVQTLCEFNRALVFNDQHAGVLLITLNDRTMSSEELTNICEQLPLFGFEVLQLYTGVGQSIDTGTKNVFQNLAIACKKTSQIDHNLLATQLDTTRFTMTPQSKVTKSRGTGVQSGGRQNRFGGTEHSHFQINGLDIDCVTTTGEKIATFVRLREKVQIARQICEKYKSLTGDKARAELKKNGMEYFGMPTVGLCVIIQKSNGPLVVDIMNPVWDMNDETKENSQ